MSAQYLEIALIGNLNNHHFSLVRNLQDLGFDSDLLLTNAEQTNFHSKCDSLVTLMALQPGFKAAKPTASWRL